jgi:hypothetical protein
MFSIPNYIKESGFDARNRKKVKICCPVLFPFYETGGFMTVFARVHLWTVL